MTVATEQVKDEIEAPDTRPAILPRLGEAIPPILQRFHTKGTLGVVLPLLFHMFPLGGRIFLPCISPCSSPG